MGIVSSLSSALGTRDDRRISSCSLIDLKDNGSPDDSTRLSFQYFPETIQDSYSTEWAQKNIIGGSHPIYQWMHGNGRQISFEAVFSADTPPKGFDQAGDGGNFLETLSTGISDIGSSIGQITKNPIGSAISALKGASQAQMDVAGGIAWLKSKLYPTYQKRVARPPAKMLLILPNSGIVSKVNGIKDDSVPVIMLSCNVTYESFFRSGSPRIVTVALEFAETIQIGTKNWSYVNRTDVAAVYQKTRFYTYKGQG